MNRQFLEKQRSKILSIARRHGVTSIKVFGSVVHGQERADSDVDFLVELQPGRSLLDLGGLQVDLEDALHCKVDVVTPMGLRKRIRPRVLRESVAL